MDGKECDAFWKMIKDTSPMTAKLEPIDKCYVCKGNDCNKHRYNGASGLTIPTVLVSAFCIILTKIVL
nr:unnamed protein product [Callosobruchus chinensis]